MFDWLFEIEKPKIGENSWLGDLKIKKIESGDSPIQMSEVCQLFASYSVIIGSDVMSQLPTPNERARSIIINEIVPHYTDVKEIYIDGVLRSINVMGLKADSVRKMQDLLVEGVYPVIPDLYRSNDPKISIVKREFRYFSVRQAAIHPLQTEETEKVRHFFENSFFADTGSVLLTPTGWTLEENLKESLTLRTFSVFAQALILMVDTKDNHVVGLDIYG